MFWHRLWAVLIRYLNLKWPWPKILSCAQLQRLTSGRLPALLHNHFHKLQRCDAAAEEAGSVSCWSPQETFQTRLRIFPLSRLTLISLSVLTWPEIQHTRDVELVVFVFTLRNLPRLCDGCLQPDEREHSPSSLFMSGIWSFLLLLAADG